jgi:ribosomal protein S18 acetylase RimI-like enzyme
MMLKRSEQTAVAVERLPWDSAFFGLDVGSIAVPFDGHGWMSTLEEMVRGSSFDLIYVFIPSPLPEPENREIQRTLTALSGVQYGSRMVFRKRFGDDSSSKATGMVTAATASRISAPLEALAYASGVYSRFALDSRLSPFFRPMYQKWLEKDFANGKVFVWPNDVHPKGMATISVREGRGVIGLVAVAEQSRGKGIASALMRTVDNWLLSQGVCECEVVTQGENLAAQALYRKAGFSCCEQTDVWHVWRKRT